MRCVLSCLLLLVLAGIGAEACKCGLLPKQQLYCDNQLVIKGEVIARKKFGTTNGEVRYKVKVLEFKGSVKKLKVWTYAESATCGFGESLLKNHVYIFAMSKNPGMNNRWWLNTCTSWVGEWSGLTPTQILGVNGAWACPFP